jgi:transposase-like protein
MIVTFLGSSVKEYLNIFLHKLAQMKLHCPICGSALVGYGMYLRKIKTTAGKVEFPIARYYCSECKRTHAIIPDFILPYKHYPAKVIEEAVEDVVEKRISPEYAEGEQDISTTKRWVKTFKLLSSEISGTLESIAFRLYGKTSSIVGEIGSCFSRLKTVLKLLPDILSCCLFGKINTWLTVENTNLWLLGKKST